MIRVEVPLTPEEKKLVKELFPNIAKMREVLGGEEELFFALYNEIIKKLDEGEGNPYLDKMQREVKLLKEVRRVVLDEW